MKCIFVYNPESGNGKIHKYRNFILSKLNEKYGEIDCVETDHPGHAFELAKESIGVYDYFFVAGGDGTINEVINGMGDAENKPIIGYIPSGTVNDVARSLGISRKIKKAVKTILEGEPFEHDTFKVNDRYGIYVCATGLFTCASYDTNRYDKKKLGKLAYVKRAIKELKKTETMPVTLTLEDETISTNSPLILILNSRSVAGFKINKNASLCDGEVEIVVFSTTNKYVTLAELLVISNTFAFGLDKLKNSKSIIYRKAKNFNITLSEGTAINLDGEKSGEGSFNFEVIQKAIKIITPKGK